jgi:cytoskeleton protein RodZ
MPGVGDTLRETREQRGVAIEAVAASTKIQPRLLRAIEDEDWDVLPGEFYAARFIHTYAEYLGLDAAALVD